jgi:site-specific DNA-methyltransferase (adenine-specific)
MQVEYHKSEVQTMILAIYPMEQLLVRWDTYNILDKLWEQYERIIRPNGAIVLTASQPFTSG